MEITSSPLNQFLTYLPATTVQRKDWNLFRMFSFRKNDLIQSEGGVNNG